MAAKTKAKAKKKKAATKPRAKAAGKKKKGDWRIACKSLADIRQNIDRLDAKIAPLLCQRLDFVLQAANFKPSAAGVVVPSRVEEIIARVRALAEAMDSPPDTIERAYRSLIDAFTADEKDRWRDLHK